MQQVIPSQSNLKNSTPADFRGILGSDGQHHLQQHLILS